MSSKNLEILHSLDIEKEFINDKKTNQLFEIYSKKKKKYYLNVLENGYSYIPLIKNEIQKAKIPTNLVFVAMAESYFSSKAKSNRSAIGLWQFIPSTARKFGLKIDNYVDERKDPIKSTVAAIKYLTYLKNKTHKWYRAIMAYNCGEARIIEAITRAKLDKYCKTHNCKRDKKIRKFRRIIYEYQYKKGSFASLYRVYKEVNKLYPYQLSIMELLKVQKKLKRQYLPKETRFYIRKIVAMSFLLNSENFVAYQNHYLLNRGNVSNLTKVKVPAGTNLSFVAKMLGIDYQALLRNNRHLRYGFTPPNEDSYIYIPYNKLADFRLNFDNIKNISKKIVYRVQKGDSLSRIGAKFGVNYRIIKDFNNLKSNFLRIGQKLVIPIKNNLKIERRVVYKVKRGDNLRYLAKKFHTSYKKIKRINRLKNDTIYQNQTLVIPIMVTVE
jgi:membrane-bound lytic murein transglycosylase D